MYDYIKQKHSVNHDESYYMYILLNNESRWLVDISAIGLVLRIKLLC
jgi:hypothetical protein